MNIIRAAEHIDATKLEDGRWAYHDDASGSYFIVDETQLGKLCDFLDHEDESIRADAYSHWCAATTAEEMPDGYEPGHIVFETRAVEGDGSCSGTDWDMGDMERVAAASAEDALDALEEWARSEDADSELVTLYVYAPDGTGDHRTITL